MTQKRQWLPQTLHAFLGAQVNDIRIVGYALAALSAWMCGDCRPGPFLKGAFHLASKGPRALRLMKRVGEHILALDEAIDLRPVEELLPYRTCPGAHFPTSLSSPFVPPETSKTVQEIIDLNIASAEEIYSFINLAAACIVEQAQAKNRQERVEVNMRLTEVTSAFFLNFFTPDKNIRAFVKNGGVLNHAKIKELFPALCRLSRIMQHHDDFLDLYKDLRAEWSTGKIMPNAFLLRADETSGLYQSSGEMRESLSRFASYESAERTRLPIKKLPPLLLAAVRDLWKDGMKSVETFSDPLRSLLWANFSRVIEGGVYITAHGDLHGHKTPLHCRFASNAALKTVGTPSFF